MNKVKQIHKWGLHTIIDSRTLYIIIGALILLPWGMIIVTPTQEEKTLYQPALAQGAWQTLQWLNTLFLVSTFASLGQHARKGGIYDFLVARNITKKEIIIGISTLGFLLSTVLAAIPAITCMLGAIPSTKELKTEWILLQLQSFSLYIVLGTMLSMLAFALAQRFSNLITTILLMAMFYYGMHGLNYVDMIRRNSLIDPTLGIMFETIWALSPHFHLTDVNQRMIFRLGEMPVKSYFATITYMLMWLLTFLSLAYLLLPKKGACKQKSPKKRLNK